MTLILLNRKMFSLTRNQVFWEKHEKKIWTILLLNEIFSPWVKALQRAIWSIILSFYLCKTITNIPYS